MTPAERELRYRLWMKIDSRKHFKDGWEIGVLLNDIMPIIQSAIARAVRAARMEDTKAICPSCESGLPIDGNAHMTINGDEYGCPAYAIHERMAREGE